MAQTPTQALRDNTVLTQENLDDNGIGVKGVEARADNTVLTKLSMAHCAVGTGIGNEGLEVLARVLRDL